ncbi:nucleotide exchange factor GrpE [Halovenus rubra]|uniref:Protein GrpE n=2 Tax=Halovenus rubra TaxID=869890 RepID=A0ABD5X759_9EURY
MDSASADEQNDERDAEERTDEETEIPADADSNERTEESVTEFLSDLATAPDEDVDAVLADIVSDRASGQTSDTDSSTERGQSVDPADVRVDDALLTELAEIPEERLAKTLAVLRTETDRLETKLAKEQERADDLESRLARKQADFQNYKKRQKKRLEDEKERATEDFVTRLLDVRDNLERALDQDEDADIRGGVESTLDQFDQQLERENVETIHPDVGKETDPRRHEVLATIAADQPEDTIAQVHRPGYVMGEKVLRPAQVAVSDGSLVDDE